MGIVFPSSTMDIREILGLIQTQRLDTGVILESHSSAFIRQLEIKTTSVKSQRQLIVLKVNHLLMDKVISGFAAERCSFCD